MGKKSTTNVERPQSAQELQLLETQNQMMQSGIAVAQDQEARSAEQHKIWKDNYLPVEVPIGKVNQKAYNQHAQRLDNQMPQYAEDTSGVMGGSQNRVFQQGQQNNNSKGGR